MGKSRRLTNLKKDFIKIITKMDIIIMGIIITIKMVIIITKTMDIKNITKMKPLNSLIKRDKIFLR
jgi:hypothetical protein